MYGYKSPDGSRMVVQHEESCLVLLGTLRIRWGMLLKAETRDVEMMANIIMNGFMFWRRILMMLACSEDRGRVSWAM